MSLADRLDRLLHPGETDKERALRRGSRALAGFRLDSIWLHKRPFSDQYDGSGTSYSGFSAGDGFGDQENRPNRNI